MRRSGEPAWPVFVTLCVLLLAAVPAVQAARGGSPQLAPAAPQAEAVGSAFTYQGNLKKDGQPANTTCSFQFGLWDAATAGVQQGTTQAVSNVAVQGGLFTVQLDFGAAFTGDARWLETAVQCAGDASFTTLAPRQLLTAAPYALGLMPGANITSQAAADALTVVQNADANGIHGQASTAASVAVRADNDQGIGLLASSTASKGVWGASTSGPGVYGESDSAPGVSGSSATGIGVKGESTSGVGVSGTSSGDSGVYGSSSAANGIGVWGSSSDVAGYGVQGSAGGANGVGVFGTSTYVAILATTTNQTTGYAGYFSGRVNITGLLSKGGGSFKIDHPLDPLNKYLSHSFVESPDMKNIYDGVVTLDAAGEAVVQLPDWFEALNQDFRYQLTCIGGYAPVYISQEVTGNQFKIAGGQPGLKVSWQVTGIRHDPFAEQNRIVVEEDKTGAEKGKYLYPRAYGQPASEGISAAMMPAAKAPAPVAPAPVALPPGARP